MVRRQGLPGVAVLGLFSAGLCALTVAHAVNHKTRHGHSSPAPNGSSGPLQTASPAAASRTNPFAEPPYSDFMRKFDIPRNHGSGIYVDLGQNKTVDGKNYREPAGRCPVVGKNIVMYQPENDPRYKNDFLEDIATEAQAKKGKPLPGGFNNNFKIKGEEPYSPMTDAKLAGFSALTAKTPLGRCAQMSYQTTAGKNSEYRYPFVYDMKHGLCYFLYISMQRMMGERYCSVNNDPPNLTWPCFHPEKHPDERPYLVYGSSYVGEDPDAWETKCPTKGVKGAVFGNWDGQTCIEHLFLEGTRLEEVEKKEDCWALAFNNAGVATDHHVNDPDENIGNLGYYFPSASSNQPKSGGVGVNYASYYGSDNICALSSQVPDCFVPIDGAVAYTALGGLEEESLPGCTSSFPESIGVCDPETCKTTVTKCLNGELTSETVDCIPKDGSTCDDNNNKGDDNDKDESHIWPIVALSIGGVSLVALLAGGFYYYRRKSRPVPNQGPRQSRAEYMQDEASGGRTMAPPADLVQQAEPSFWDEVDEEPDEGEYTEVLVDRDY